MRAILALCLALLAIPVAHAQKVAHTPHADVPAPPATPRHAASSVLHGVRVNDPYRWLESGDNAAVEKWIKAQNAYAAKVLDAMPDAASMARRVGELALATTVRSAPRLAAGRLFYLQQTPTRSQPVLMVRKWPDGKPHALLDLSQYDGHAAITGYWPSPDGRYLAYGTTRAGKGLTTLHVLDLATHRLLGDTLPWAGGETSSQSVAWDPDDKGFIYVRFPPPVADGTVKPFHAALVHHTLGQPAYSDKVVFGKDFSPIAEYRLLSSGAGTYRAILAKAGDGAPWEVFLGRDGKWQRILDAKADVRGATWDGNRLLVESFADAPLGKVLAIDAATDKVDTVLSQRHGALQQLAPIAQGFIAVRSQGPHWWADQYDAHGILVRRLGLPTHDISIGNIASAADQPEALVSYGGWILPSRWSRYDARNGKLTTVFEVKPAADYSLVSVTHLHGTSKDGTQVPVTVLHLRDVLPDGHRPTILYGYGGFGVPIRPGFIGPYLAWLERGGVLAYANTRGGNANGEGWHRDGQGRDKQNVFDDFFAAAKALEDSGWTDPDHLGIMGGGNGGLLMGVELTQHPDAFRAVVSNTGIYDVIRHETQWANGKYNVPEYGAIKDDKDFKAILAYSPLQHVKAGTDYPAVLMTTGIHDTRVAPWQSRKFAAALQAATHSGAPILLVTHMPADNTAELPFALRAGNAVLSLTFFAHELGLPMGRHSRHAR